ncbi:DNA-3-methyladenine glycosylase [soil metagenome]
MLIPTPLTDETLVEAASELAARDPDLAQILTTFGPPPLWAREPGFPTLLHIILEQQVSLASARATFERLRTVATPLIPETFLALDDDTLRAVGFSRQKTAYGRYLALAVVNGELDLASMADQDDATVRAALVKLKGIGVWSADVYLLMALRRPNIWPVGDLGLVVALQEIKQLPTRPLPIVMEVLAEPWQPWRAVAARLLWHYYLNTR